jgi:hypothetical protein
VPEYIGAIVVPALTATEVFPVLPDFPHGRVIEPQVVIHQFGSASAKIEQRYLLGDGAIRFHVVKHHLNDTDRALLTDFWDTIHGPAGIFLYDAPDDQAGTVTRYTVRFDNAPLSVEMLGAALASVGVTLVEVGTDTPEYTVTATLPRVPDATLKAGLLPQVQRVIPLVKIQVKESGYDPIYVSDRRLQLNPAAQVYQARLLKWEGISQGLGGVPDDARFTFGNADRVMRDLANDTDLNRATVEFSLFHVGTGIKLDLWKGEVTDWESDEGPEFTLVASDIYELGLPHPARKFSRTCWKEFDDGNGCPATAEGGSSLGDECDKGFSTPLGCIYHTMQTYFGGIVAQPQSVRIKDNSTGTWGYRRSSITSVSLQEETVYDQVVPEIYTNVPMQVNCRIVSGREESDFYDALGVIGEGPLTPNADGNTLDGQPNHGPGTKGLRVSLGADPNTDAFGLTTGVVGETLPSERAAGTAFIEIRRMDEKGFAPTRLAEHSMKATVGEGLKGWVWTATNTRTSVMLTNPIWVAVNMVIRALGLRYATALQCEAVFDLPSALAAAAICDTPVEAALGPIGTCSVSGVNVSWSTGTKFYSAMRLKYLRLGGTNYLISAAPDDESIELYDAPGDGAASFTTWEKQFEFKGVIGEEKPLRDWLAEVLANCNGYYTFAAGKLKLGIRSNSSTVEAFTNANILFGSLQTSGAKPTFNHLTGTYADEVTGFVLDGLPIYDIDHAKSLGSISPVYLKKSMNLCGSASRSQVGRVIVPRLREELGGISTAEWLAKRRVAFKTTDLALNVEPGMVCSMTHADMPGGAGEFRVETVRWNPDHSIDIQGATTTDSMYDLTVGPKPADVTPDAPPVAYAQYPRGLAWHPHAEQPAASDPMFATDDWSFGLTQDYATMADETMQAGVVVQGKLPVSVFIPGIDPPSVRYGTLATAGGALLGAHQYWWSVCAIAADGRMSPPSNIVTKYTAAGTDTNMLTLSGITWPAGTWTGYVLFGAVDDERLLCWQAEVTAALPASIAITAMPSRSTWGLPSPWLRRVRIRGKRVRHSGPVGATVTSVSTDTIVCAELATFADDWTGRVLSVIADLSDGSAPLWNFAITDYTALTGTFTVTPDPLAAGVAAGDVLVVRTAATTVTATTIEDTGWLNGTYPAGMTVNEEIGNLVRVLSGPGRGQIRRITSNTADTCTIDTPWDTDDLPTSASVWIVEAPLWAYLSESEVCNASTLNVQGTMRMPIDNLLNQVALIQCTTLDEFGVETPESLACVREIYLFGMPGQFVRDYYLSILLLEDPIRIGSDVVTNRGRVRVDPGTVVELTECALTAKTPPSGEDFIANILSSPDGYAWTSIFPDGSANMAVIPAGNGISQITVFRSGTLANDTLIRVDVSQTGGALGVTMELRGRVVTS